MFKRILLVADDTTLAELVAELTAIDVIASTREENPDLVVLDGAAPDAAAWAALLHSDRPQLPILFIADPDQLDELPSSIHELAIKPLRPGELITRMQLIARRQRATATPREKLLATAVEAAGDVIEIASPQPRYEYVNPAFVRKLGFMPDEVIGRSPASILRSGMHDEAYYANIEQTLAAGNPWRGLIISKAKSGRHVYFDMVVSPVLSDEGTMTHLVCVKRDITDRLETEHQLRQVNAELEQARDAALEASRSKSQFLANMSHELRTPLNAIIGYSEILLEELAGARHIDPEQVRSDVEKIRTAGGHLLDLINDVLDLSKIEAGAMQLHYEDFDLRSLVESVVATITPLVQERGNRLQVRYGRVPTHFCSDLTKLRQSLLNLLSNAAKFTASGEIVLEIDQREHKGQTVLAFRITDTGIGMSTDELARIFQPFVQADASTTRRYGGTGLGLAITHRYCKMLGGAIEVTSAPGRGSTFEIFVPAGSSSERPSSQSTDLPSVRHGVRVLLIDDDESVQESVARMLERHGFEVCTCGSGQAGVEVAYAWQPHLVLLDLVMADLDGWAVLGHLKQSERTANVPVVMLTSAEERQLAFTLGAVDFLLKPVEPERLLRVVTRHCS